jgi:predicted Zn-dependent protease
LPRPLAVALVCVSSVLSLVACATNPVTGRREFTLMSESQELQLGLQSDAGVRQEMGLYADPALQRYVQELGDRLAATSERPRLTWHFAVVDVAAVNAFALPGGYIYITRGILPYLETEAELAGVIGHEIGHVTARHAAQQYTRAATGQLVLGGLGVFSRQARAFGQVAGTGLGVLFLKYGRDDERQADGLGVRYASRAGWDPRGVPRMLATLGRLEATSDRSGVPNWLLTHPQPLERVGEVEPAVREAEASPHGDAWAIGRESYLRRIDGIVVGENPREGVVRGAEFVHPDLRLAVAFPPGWTLNNGKTAVIAARPDGAAFVLLQPVTSDGSRALPDLARASMTNAGFRLVDGRRARVNGLDAYLGSYDGTLENGSAVRVEAAHVALGGQVYLLAGIAAATAQPPREFEASIRSFRELSRAEADGVKPNRLALYTARPGDSWERLAADRGNLVTGAALAVMNGRSLSDPPRPGERLKVVVAE